MSLWKVEVVSARLNNIKIGITRKRIFIPLDTSHNIIKCLHPKIIQENHSSHSNPKYILYLVLARKFHKTNDLYDNHN